jgi:hypothetical protein
MNRLPPESLNEIYGAVYGRVANKMYFFFAEVKAFQSRDAALGIAKALMGT